MKTFSILALVASVGLLLSACADGDGWHHHHDDGPGYHNGDQGGGHDGDHHDNH